MSQEFFERWNQLSPKEREEIRRGSEQLRNDELGIIVGIEQNPDREDTAIIKIASLPAGDTDSFRVELAHIGVITEHVESLQLFMPVFITRNRYGFRPITAQELYHDKNLAHEVTHLQEEIRQTAYGWNGRADLTVAADDMTFRPKTPTLH